VRLAQALRQGPLVEDRGRAIGLGDLTLNRFALGGLGLGQAEMEGRVQALGDARGLGLHDRGDRRRHHLVGGLSPQRQPVAEHLRRDARGVLQVDRHRIALVAAAGQHHRRPEVGQGPQVVIPVLNGVVEHRAQLGVGADAGVEALQQRRQRGFDLGGLGRVHRGA